MSKQWLFEDKDSFLIKLEELQRNGVPPRRLKVLTPFHVHEVEHLLHIKTSPVRLFALIGALTGLVTGFALTIYTVREWPLITGGKPLISLPAFMIIAFELTILFGALASFAGFLLVSRLPAVDRIQSPEDIENRFVIIELDEEQS